MMVINDNDLYCSICLIDIIDDKQTLLCGHNFHKKCISLWFVVQQNKFTCPECRHTEISNPNVRYNNQIYYNNNNISSPLSDDILSNYIMDDDYDKKNNINIVMLVLLVIIAIVTSIYTIYKVVV